MVAGNIVKYVEYFAYLTLINVKNHKGGPVLSRGMLTRNEKICIPFTKSIPDYGYLVVCITERFLPKQACNCFSKLVAFGYDFYFCIVVIVFKKMWMLALGYSAPDSVDI